jgi:TRAP-type C4-dicarboxylate transport system permease small subunit
MFSAYIATSLSFSVFGDKGSFTSGEVRPATGIPAWVILFSGVVSFSLITVRSFAYGIWALKHPEEQSEEEKIH